MSAGTREGNDPLKMIINKAVWLLANGRVVKMSDYMYYVMGRKNRHIVKVENNRLVCTCPGFKERGICSHVVAVSTIRSMQSGMKLLEETVRDRVEREIRMLTKQGYRR